MKRSIAVLCLASVLLLTALTAPAPSVLPLDPYQPPVNATSVIRIWGDRHLEAVARAWAQEYHSRHPERSFEIKLLGNGTAMPALYLGVADVALFGRDLIVTDKDGFNHVMKYDPLRIELGTGSLATPGHATALALFVHADNPLARLSLKQVDAIFSSQRRRGGPVAIRTWGQLGLKGEWAEQPIHLYADDTQSMTALFFQRVALGDSRRMNWDHFTEFPDVQRPDGTWLEAAGQSMAALRQDRFGLAISTLHHAGASVKALALAVEDGDIAYLPTRENLTSRRYPLTRPIFACVNQPPGKPLDPKVRDFLRFALSREGQGILAQASDYLPLDPAMADQELAKLP